MKRQLIFFGFSLLCLLWLSSCYKDQGDYEYTDINNISITTNMDQANPQVVINNDSIVVKQSDSLMLDILVSQTRQSDDLSYQWMITQSDPSFANPVQYVIGKEKKLRTKIILPPNLYKLVVKVTDNKTGVSSYKFYTLNVDTSPWGGEGWLVLQDQSATEGGCDISIITSRDGVSRGSVYHNLYFGANGHKLPNGTYKTSVLNYNSTLRIQKVSFFYPNGGIQVRSVDYLDSSTHAGWFLLPPYSINIQSNSVFPASGQHEFVVNDGQFYFQSVNATSIKNPPIKLNAPYLGSWSEISPYVLMGNADGTFTLFDKANRCFFTAWNNGGTLTLVPTSRADVPNNHYATYSGAGGTTTLGTNGKGFDMNNIGRDLVYAENVSPMSGTIYNDCIFRNTAGDSTFLYQFQGTFDGATGGYVNNFTSGRFYLSSGKVPGINEASIFAVPTFLTISGTSYGVFYYVHGTEKNSIYICNPSYTGIMPATTSSSLGYSFPAGTIIKAMKVFKSGYTTAPSTESKYLVVATDETANGNGNNVYYFELNPTTGGIINTPANVYTGFDKITDITFKKGLGF